MTFLDLKFALSKFLIFSLNDIRKVDSAFDRRRLVEWQEKGYIKKVIKKYYIFSDLELDERSLFVIANKIYDPSYISLESALSYYNLIPEGVFSVTSITSNKTNIFHTDTANFYYNSVKEVLMFGYLIQYDRYNMPYQIADIEKTVLDYFYIHSDLKTEDDFFEMRFNAEEFLSRFDEEKFLRYLNVFQNKELEKRMHKFLIFLKND
jgi:predicted transcriptional regulator of viral defense system